MAHGRAELLACNAHGTIDEVPRLASNFRY